ARSGEQESEEAVRLRREDRDGHRHRTSGALPGLLRVDGAELMAKAGLTPKQVLTSATRDAARCQKLDRDLGTLEANKWADFVVLDADPLANVSNARQIADVYVAGNRVER